MPVIPERKVMALFLAEVTANKSLHRRTLVFRLAGGFSFVYAFWLFKR